MRFLRDIRDVAKTRKFWVGMAGAVLDAVVLYLSGVPEFSPVIKALTVFGIYEIPNRN